MDIASIMIALDEMLHRLRVGFTIYTDDEWAELQRHLDELERAARRRRLPVVKVGAEAARLRHSLGVVLGKLPPNGHGREQHLAWATDSVQGLRSSHCFGPVLRAPPDA